jgi:predicted enzyme related to lactoylglutathione lyase
MQLSLLVIRSAMPEKLMEFYEHLGLIFEHHRHGTGPFHFSAKIGPTVLEIYPLGKGQEVPDKYLRLGLSIDSFEATIHELKKNGIYFHQPLIITEWGVMAVIEDPEGRKIELTESTL